MRERGWIEGQNFAVKRRYSEGRNERLQGLAAELIKANAAMVTERGLDLLDAPIVRVAARNVPMPYNDKLELATIPSRDDIMAAVRGVLAVARAPGVHSPVRIIKPLLGQRPALAGPSHRILRAPCRRRRCPTLPMRSAGDNHGRRSRHRRNRSERRSGGLFDEDHARAALAKIQDRMK
jgi:hypothetical protein